MIAMNMKGLRLLMEQSKLEYTIIVVIISIVLVIESNSNTNRISYSNSKIKSNNDSNNNKTTNYNNIERQAIGKGSFFFLWAGLRQLPAFHKVDSA